MTLVAEKIDSRKLVVPEIERGRQIRRQVEELVNIAGAVYRLVGDAIERSIQIGRSIDVVTVDGRVRTCRPTQNRRIVARRDLDILRGFGLFSVDDDRDDLKGGHLCLPYACTGDDIQRSIVYFGQKAAYIGSPQTARLKDVNVFENGGSLNRNIKNRLAARTLGPDLCEVKDHDVLALGDRIHPIGRPLHEPG